MWLKNIRQLCGDNKPEICQFQRTAALLLILLMSLQVRTKDFNFVLKYHRGPRTKVENNIRAHGTCVASVANCDRTVAVDGVLIRRNSNCRPQLIASELTVTG